MDNYRNRLPQLGGEMFLTDGGLETTLAFHEGLELPYFASFDVLRSSAGRAALRRYFRAYTAIARRFGTGLILEAATWRASADWGARLGYGRKELAAANRRSIELLEEVRAEAEPQRGAIVISGCLGPRGDGYEPGHRMGAREAESYHRDQVDTFSDSAADMICAMTINYVEEAIGIARAARRARMPVAISFTVETDGRLPTRETLSATIERVDAATSGYPSYYMVNCAHPAHLEQALKREEVWTERLRGFRANASRKSHAELNESAELDAGSPIELGSECRRLLRGLPNLNVLGGCCGTDHRHIEAIARACSTRFRTA